MNKLELARRLARLSRRSRSSTADDLDALVYALQKKTKPSAAGNSPGTKSTAACPLPTNDSVARPRMPLVAPLLRDLIQKEKK